MNPNNKNQTPLMQQYWTIKSAHQDQILFFRMGDFYEMFFEDAVQAAPLLGIALTSRNKKAADETPMCGIPHHSVAGPINKLLAHGLKVAICDQIEDPKQAKGIVNRAVTRILTPGMVYDSENLNPNLSNFIGCYKEGVFACAETSTGDCYFFRGVELNQLGDLMGSLNVVELVVDESDSGEKSAFQELLNRPPAGLTISHHKVASSPHSLSENQVKSVPAAALCLNSYISALTAQSSMPPLRPYQELPLLGKMKLTQQTLRHLEIFKSFSGEESGTFFSAINRTKTAAGARRLRQRIAFPEVSKETLENKWDDLERWITEPTKLSQVRKELSLLGDLERRATRIAQSQANARDLIALGEALQRALAVTASAELSVANGEQLHLLAEDILKCFVSDPPISINQGGMIQKGISSPLDEQIELSSNAQNILLEMEQRERTSTGISSLKIRYNGVFGYYIEVTNTHKNKVPSHYLRKQTLATAERFSTPELVDLEQKILLAQSRRAEIELEIFQLKRKHVLDSTQSILSLALLCAELDVQTSLAHLALERSYVRPSLRERRGLTLKASRHPVVEQTVSSFVPNDIEIDGSECLLLTGPNMAGKSTLMRQVALIQIMTQMGSFVPCSEAQLSLCDQIFTRIGASDNLAQGLSTFMVEMTETSEMIAHAGERSLVILDEIGRGTSTYDGLSLAQAILEHFLRKKVSCILFATHYHEITRLDKIFPQIKNVHMSVVDRRHEIQFLHTLMQGPAQKSYGIQVAKLAGIPKDVTDRAAQILRDLEQPREIGAKQLSIFQTEQEPLAVSSSAAERIKDVIERLDLERMTPLQAFMELQKWKSELVP